MNSEVSEHRLNNTVYLLGYRSDIGEILSECDIFVLCSLHETLCNSIIEAGQQSLPTIATNVGGIKEIIQDGYNGYLVNPFESNDVIRLLKKLIKDKEHREQMGQNAKKIIRQKFDPDASFNKLKDLYEKTLHNNVV